MGHDGRIHLKALDAVPDPESLTTLGKNVSRMLSRVDLSQIVLEVMGWEPGFVEAFRSWSGGDVSLDGLDISVAACLTAQAMNVGYGPMVSRTIPALQRDRLSHVAQTYINAENTAAANRPLIERQAGIDFACQLGGGLVAAVDGMRFVVPVPDHHAHHCLALQREEHTEHHDDQHPHLRRGERCWPAAATGVSLCRTSRGRW